ncbi:siderophore ABC transporter substrate-binding protein [Ornithinibacillus halophilus]|uniref:Iron complex transport system substrate-binding protein n=1 Tax=Ornithinibacillus halophilus TaxID=930117 RepID=A0A1M5H130_9BACI|nr:siderophore ABC transporter substrate-binding protein [Ornithinibacillus halophilus]SHG09658.1 iron complex transport system substrate-binding protein [Ornithinibacillus halophilus]
MKKILMVLAISFITLVITACGSTEDNENTNTGSNSNDEVTISHELGETDVLVNPKKVVVFDFGILDTLDALGLEVAGIPKSSTTPDYLEKYSGDDYENVGSLKEPDFEKIAEINPDLIIISGRQASLIDQFEELAPTIHLGVDTTRYMESFKENMNAVGQIFDKQKEIDEELAEIDTLIQELNDKASSTDKNALIILANDDKISAYGANSRFGLIHDVFGVTPVDEGIEASTHGMNVTFEYVKENDPDLLYVIDRSAVVGGESNAKQIVENKLMENTKAYQNDTIYYLNPDYWYLSGGGLISVKEMIKEIDGTLN